MTTITQGALTMVGLNTETPKVFWNGRLVSGVVGIRVDWDADEQRVKLIVNGDDHETYLSMTEGGVTVKRVLK